MLGRNMVPTPGAWAKRLVPADSHRMAFHMPGSDSASSALSSVADVPMCMARVPCPPSGIEDAMLCLAIPHACVGVPWLRPFPPVGSGPNSIVTGAFHTTGLAWPVAPPPPPLVRLCMRQQRSARQRCAREVVVANWLKRQFSYDTPKHRQCWHRLSTSVSVLLSALLVAR